MKSGPRCSTVLKAETEMTLSTRGETMEIKRETCNGCGCSFQFAPNSAGTQPTECLICDPENERAVPVDVKLNTLAVAFGPKTLQSNESILVHPRAARCNADDIQRVRDWASKAASRKRAEAVRAAGVCDNDCDGCKGCMQAFASTR